jgi:hypothetical protein
LQKSRQRQKIDCCKKDTIEIIHFFPWHEKCSLKARFRGWLSRQPHSLEKGGYKVSDWNQTPETPREIDWEAFWNTHISGDEWWLMGHELEEELEGICNTTQ